MNILEAIERRKSVRNYKNEPVSLADLAQIKAAVPASACGPFGNTLRTTILHPSDDNPAALKGLAGPIGTYGFIKHAQAFAVGAIPAAPFSLHDYGYLMEGVVLEATRCGVGSCWLGGSFRPGPFGKAIAVQDGEFVPAVIAMGYPSEKRRIADTMIELHHNKRNQRADFDTLFFDQNDFESPADSEALGSAAIPLHAVHAAPSSCNTQPWRVVKDGEGQFHVFFQRNLRYTKKDKLIGNADLQHIDMGIAMRHFEVAARACDMPGGWSVLESTDTQHVPAGAEYLVSWRRSS